MTDVVLVDSETGEVLDPELLPEGVASPPELARIANEEHKQAREAGGSMLVHAFRAGEALVAAKSQQRHGQWLPWLAANFEGSERIARYYMKVSTNRQRVADLDEGSLRKAIKAASGAKDDGELVQQSLTNEWYTPDKYIAAARDVLGGIDLDPASCDEANQTVQAKRFLVREDDGLTFEWHGTVWLNPPYGRSAGDFVSYLVDEYDRGHVTAAVTLVNAHCTDTTWFQKLWDHTLCFTDHRINFAAGTEDRSGSTHGSVFAYLGPHPNNFADAFHVFGPIVRAWP